MITAFIFGVVAGIALTILSLCFIGWLVGPEEESQADDSEL